MLGVSRCPPASSHAVAAGGCTGAVAATSVFGSAPDGAVVVVVAEVPWCVGADRQTTSPADGLAGLDEWAPPFTLCTVGGTVAALLGGQHQAGKRTEWSSMARTSSGY